MSAGDVGVGAADDMDDDEVRPVLRGVTVCGMCQSSELLCDVSSGNH